MPETAPLYRDSSWLVVPRNVSNFAERCWWTNEPTEGLTRDVTIIDPKGEYQFGIAYGFRKATLKDKVRIPCTAAWQADNKGQKLLMKRRILAICLPLMLLSAVFFGSLLATLTDDELKKGPVVIAVFASVGVFGLGLVGSVIGLALPYLEDAPGTERTMVVGLITDSHYWIAGAHPDFLAQLKAWEGPKREEYLAQRKGFMAAASEAWPVLVAWLAVVFLTAAITALRKKLF